MRKLRGDAADWTLTEVLLARLDYRLAGANWQRAGGKGGKPKPLEVPGAKAGSKTQKSRAERGEDAAQRLRNLGLIPATPGQRPGPLPDGQPSKSPTASEFQRALEDELLAREMRLANEA
jgi:hypothetical protein